jgi:hypothetical protein
MNAFGVVLVGMFVIGAVAMVSLLAYGIVHAVRDKRTRNERLADEHGDLAPGTFKITPGMGGNAAGGGGGVGL